MAATSPNSDDLLSRLKFRAVQPVDIPRCHHLETLSFTADNAASISELQLRQHRAAPFFRCVLLKKPKQEKVEHDLADLEISNGNGNDSEACHHSVHGTSENELIGYISGTRALDFVDVDAVLSADRNEQQQSTESTYLYSTKHEPNGRYLVIHSLVVQQEYRNLGVARAMLENYINAMEILNGEADEAGINRRRKKLKGVKRKIEKIVLLADSTLLDFFVSVGFRWRRTLTVGADPLYVRLCKEQKCFRSRLTTKPWRLDPPVKPSIDEPSDEWIAKHENRSAGFGMCRQIGWVGAEEVLPEFFE